MNMEGYMLNFHDMSQTWMHLAFKELMGPFQFNSFNHQYLSSYMAEADVAFIKAAGFNTIRIPINMNLFYIEDYPELVVQ